MGVWMQDEGKVWIRIPPMSSVLFMLVKLILLPLLMIGLAKAVRLDNDATKAAVIITSFPIVAAAFPLAGSYEVGKAILADNLIFGTLLMVPTVLLWEAVMNAILD